VTDRRRLVPGEGSAGVDRLVEFTRAAAHAGVDLIQLRERDLSSREQQTLATRCLEGARGTGCRILVNDRVDVSIAAEADGVHLRGDSVEGEVVRALAGDHFLIGRSVHGAVEAADVAASGALDYLVFGTVFRTESKPKGATRSGLEELSRAAEAVSLPLLAIGGVTIENAGSVIKAGAAGIAAIGLFIPPSGADLRSHLDRVVQRLRQLFDTR